MTTPTPSEVLADELEELANVSGHSDRVSVRRLLLKRAAAALRARPPEGIGATCGSCGFRYLEYHGHIIPCPRCAVEKYMLRAAASSGGKEG